MMIKGHYLYTEKNNTRLYYNGETIEQADYTEVNWAWTADKKDAILLPTPDAWELLHFARMEFTGAVIEVERVMNDI